MSSGGQEVAHLQFVLCVLSHAGTIGVNWNRVAEENGIGYARNGTSKFKDIVKKYGYKFEQNTLIKADGQDQMSSPPTTPQAKKSKATPLASRPTKTPKGRKTQPKKRKLDDMEEEADTADDYLDGLQDVLKGEPEVLL